MSIDTIRGNLDITMKSLILFLHPEFLLTLKIHGLLMEQRQINKVVEREVSCLYTFFRDAVNIVILCFSLG